MASKSLKPKAKLKKKVVVLKKKYSKKRQADIDAYEKRIDNIVKKAKTASVSSTSFCPNPAPDPHGVGESAENHAKAAAIRKKKAAIRTKLEKYQLNKAVEGIGESAALQYLRDALAANKMTYNPNGLLLFENSGVFNIVYLIPPPTPHNTPGNYIPQYVIVIEAKGGTSRCGTCQDTSGADVKQGTKEYLETVAKNMASSNYRSKSKLPADVAERKRRRVAGAGVLKAIKSHKGAYFGVRGDYTASGLVAPEPIFAESM